MALPLAAAAAAAATLEPTCLALYSCLLLAICTAAGGPAGGLRCALCPSQGADRPLPLGRNAHSALPPFACPPLRCLASRAPFAACPVQFGKYVLEKQRAEWSDQYVGQCASLHPQPLLPTRRRIQPNPAPFTRRRFPPPTSALHHPSAFLFPADYKGLKDLIKESAAEEATAGVQSFSPRTTSLTVQRAADRRDSGARLLPRRRVPCQRCRCSGGKAWKQQRCRAVGRQQRAAVWPGATTPGPCFKLPMPPSSPPLFRGPTSHPRLHSSSDCPCPPCPPAAPQPRSASSRSWSRRWTSAANSPPASCRSCGSG